MENEVCRRLMAPFRLFARPDNSVLVKAVVVKKIRQEPHDEQMCTDRLCNPKF